MGVKPGLTRGPGKITDRREATCSVCRNGIFEGQPRAWSRKPLGLVHTSCMPPATESEARP